MKQLTKPTRQQKILLQKRRMNPSDWMVERDTPKELVLVHRHFNNTRRAINKEVNDERY
jgi:hypothetical protein